MQTKGTGIGRLSTHQQQSCHPVTMSSMNWCSLTPGTATILPAITYAIMSAESIVRGLSAFGKGEIIKPRREPGLGQEKLARSCLQPNLLLKHIDVLDRLMEQQV
nr:hypothetical protein BgiMline_003587 [Biomphalaria glabrata]